MANYINKEEFTQEILKSQEQGRLTENAGRGIIMICDGIQSKYQYDNDDIKNDVRSHAIITACEKWKKFNIERSQNAFSFMTGVIHNGLKEGMNEFQKHNISDSIDDI